MPSIVVSAISSSSCSALPKSFMARVRSMSMALLWNSPMRNRTPFDASAPVLACPVGVGATSAVTPTIPKTQPMTTAEAARSALVSRNRDDSAFA